MIRHIVFWKFKDEYAGRVKAENLHRARQLLEGCARLVPGILKFEVATARPGLEATCDLVLYVEFADKAALRAYAEHPDHGAVKSFLGGAKLERQCMDYVA